MVPRNYEVSLKDQVTLGSDATKQIAMDGTTGTIKAGDKVTSTATKVLLKAGDKVTIDGKDGKIAAENISYGAYYWKETKSSEVS